MSRRRYSGPNPPWPGKNLLVYERESNNPYWERRRKTAMELVPESSPIDTFEYDDQLLNFFNDMAMNEETKEIRFLDEFFPDWNLSQPTPTQAFNYVLQGRPRYEALLDRIKNLEAEHKKSKYKGMAPNLFSVYSTYLSKNVRDAITPMRALLRQAISENQDTSKLKEQFDQLINDKIIETIKQMEEKVTDQKHRYTDIYGLGDQWAGVFEIINGDDYLRGNFIKKFRQKVNFDKLFEEMGTASKFTTTARLLERSIHLKSQTAQYGGTIAEGIMPAFAALVDGKSGGNDSIQWKMNAYGGQISSERGVTDAALIFTYDAEINAQEIFESLNKIMDTNNGEQKDTYLKIQEFYDSQKENLNKFYSLFINAKNYQLFGGHSGYDQEQKGTLEELPDFLNSAGISINTSEFLSFAYNTAEGAIRQGNSADFLEQCSMALKAAAAKLMFDDYQTVGTADNNSIHLYLLSGKYVPSSQIFKSMGQAANEALKFSKTAATITPVQPVDDPGPDGWNGVTDMEIKSAIEQHWRKEAVRRRTESVWTVTLTTYISNIVKNLN